MIITTEWKRYSHQNGLSKIWLAKIIGVNAEFTYEREFIKKEIDDNGKQSTVDIEFRIVNDNAIYEYRNFRDSCSKQKSGFFKVDNGSITELTKEDIKIHFNPELKNEKRVSI